MWSFLTEILISKFYGLSPPSCVLTSPPSIFMSLWQPTDFWWIFFVFEGGGNNSDREELRSEKQTKCEGDGGGVRCSWGLLWSHVGSFSLRRLRHDSLSAQNGLRHISMSDLCVCLTLRTDVNSAGARRWSAAAAAAECWHTCRAKKKSTHTYTHAQSQSRLGQSGSKHLYSWKVLHWLHHLQCSI